MGSNFGPEQRHITEDFRYGSYFCYMRLGLQGADRAIKELIILDPVGDTKLRFFLRIYIRVFSCLFRLV